MLSQKLRWEGPKKKKRKTVYKSYEYIYIFPVLLEYAARVIKDRT